MDEKGFQAYLFERKLITEDKLEACLAMARRFEAHLEQEPETPAAMRAWEFTRTLVEQKADNWDNLLTLLRYAYFTRQDDIYVAIMELLDGYEAQGNLYKRVGERYGDDVRDRVFDGIGLAPLGLPTPEKPAFMHPVIERLQAEVGQADCIELLSSSLRDLPDEYYLDEREKYQQAADIDAFLVQKKAEFITQLETLMREGRLFFSQPITPEVIELVRQDPEIGGGARQGSVIYESKIPYMTQAYLDETDETRKRYYYCHCPWSRDAILSGEQVNANFCNCSAGFHKRNWEVIFGQTLQVEVLETVLLGDARCRFAIHLPEDALDANIA